MSRHRVHVVCGGAGAGKTSYGLSLALELGAALFDSDEVTERLTKLVLSGHGLSPDDRNSSEYKRLLREPVYETLFDLAATKSLRQATRAIA